MGRQTRENVHLPEQCVLLTLEFLYSLLVLLRCWRYGRLLSLSSIVTKHVHVCAYRIVSILFSRKAHAGRPHIRVLPVYTHPTPNRNVYGGCKQD